MGTIKTYKWLNIAIILLLLWKALLMFYFPYPNIDGPWALSHTFSILNGNFFKSSFAHSYMGFYNIPYMYGLLTAPLYAAFTNTSLMPYSIFNINLILIALTLIIANSLL